MAAGVNRQAAVFSRRTRRDSVLIRSSGPQAADPTVFTPPPHNYCRYQGGAKNTGASVKQQFLFTRIFALCGSFRYQFNHP